MAKKLKRPSTNPAPRPRQPSPGLPGQPSGIPHEKVFEMFRDLGPDRTFRKLAEAVRLRWPANAVAYSTLAQWAKQHGWKKHIAEYERGLRRATQAAAPAIDLTGTDDVTVLEKAASVALARALQAGAVAVTKPGDVKALVDTAGKALELAERLKQGRSGTATSQEIAAFGDELVGKIDEARRKDFVACAKAAAEAACEAAGIVGKDAMVRVIRASAGALGCG